MQKTEAAFVRLIASLAAGLELMRLDRSRCSGRFAVNRGWLHRGEGAIGTLHDGICGAKTGQCRGRMRACLRPAASQRGWSQAG